MALFWQFFVFMQALQFCMSDVEIRIALTLAKIQMRYRTNFPEKQCKEIF